MNDIKRDGFTFFKSFYECVSDFPTEEQALLYRYIIEYALLDKDPTIENVYLNSLFKAIRPNIDSSIKRYDQRIKNNEKRSEEAQRKRNISESEPNKSRTISESEPKDSLNKNKNKNNNENKNKNNNENNIFLSDEFPKELRDKLIDFDDMRKDINKPLNNKVRKIILDQLFSYTDNLEDMIKILDISIVGRYPNIYKLKTSKNNNNDKKNLSPTDILKL